MRVRIRIPRRRPKKLVARSSPFSGRMALITLAVAVAGSIGALFGENGLMAVLQMRSRAAQLEYQILVKERTNEVLRETIRPLQEEDPDAIEKLARERHFMTRPGDTIYVLPPQPTEEAAPRNEPERGESGSPTAPSLPFRR